MLPDTTTFPKFVADQLLTSDDLNNLFGYLDSQERLTRTHLIGMGIVCGLDVFNNATGSQITITKGCGITSQGYLVQMEDSTVFMQYKQFVLQEPQYPDAFTTPLFALAKQNKLWELKEAAEDNGGTAALTDTFLADKIVLLFVDLPQEQNKNCNPASCDDKGVRVTATVRALLVQKQNAEALAGGVAGTGAYGALNGLPEVRIRRFDVPNTSPAATEAIFQAYLSILNKAFLQQVELVLTNAYKTFKPFLAGQFLTNPFAGLAGSFAFLNNGNITAAQLVYLQYYYDFFSDLLQAYDEFKNTGASVITACCPQEDVFPRHLLLGEAIRTGDPSSAYRHYFVASPLFGKQHLAESLQLLFRRLVELKTAVLLPPFSEAIRKAVALRITPSELSNAPLSAKAIPYYYKPAPLYRYWNSNKEMQGKAAQNLSYHASAYNNTDDFVLNPLSYDLEPYNFLRIEGHIGRNYRTVLQSLTTQITTYRLPIQVVLLKTGTPPATSGKRDTSFSTDLETSYDIVRREWEAIVGKTIEYINRNKKAINALIGEKQFPITSFAVKLAKAKRFMYNSLDEFVTSYDTFRPWFESIEQQANALRDVLTTSVKRMPLLAEDLIDHLDEIILSCKKGAFRALYQAYTYRTEAAANKLYFSEFAKQHPGLQHKAGVPLGGTFVLVYHQPAIGQPANANTLSHAGRTEAVAAAAPTSETVNKVGLALEANYKQFTGKSIKQLLSKTDYYQLVESVMSNTFLASGLAFTPATHATAGIPWLAQLEDIAAGTVIADFYLPYSCCSNGVPIQISIQEPLPNKVPVALIRAPKTVQLPARELTLDGTGSFDPEGGKLQYQWKLQSGQEGIVFTEENGSTTAVTGFAAGTYTFQLVVTDDAGATGEDTADVVVIKAENRPPVAVIQPVEDTTLPNTEIALDGSRSTDPEGAALSFLWEQKSGPATANITDKESAVTKVLDMKVAGAYTFALTVKDEEGATDTKQITATVKPATPACADLTKIIEEFNGFTSVEADAATVKAFRALQIYKTIKAYFDQMVQDNVAGMPVAKQLDFFVATKFTSQVQDWLTLLFNAHINEGSRFRLLATALYRILYSLLTYVACIQADDYNKDPVATEPVFGLLIEQLTKLTDRVANFTPVAKEQLKLLLDLFETERARADLANRKPEYAAALDKLTAIIKSYPF